MFLTFPPIAFTELSHDQKKAVRRKEQTTMTIKLLISLMAG
jgi:hypothetical protein